jgi:hypothetical protein
MGPLARLLAPVVALVFCGPACVVERTVRDSHGNVILQDTDLTSPFESDAEKFQEVQEEGASRGYGW